MTPNPLYNALFAIAYIMVLVSVIFVGPQLVELPDSSVFYPMLALSTLVLSVALMAYLFFYQPIILVLDGKREEGGKLFLRTVGIFGVIVVGLLLVAIVLGF